LLSPAVAAAPHAGAQLAAGWPLLLYLGVVPTAAAYVVFGAGLRRVTATAAGIATLLEPVTAATLGVLVFGERLGGLGWVGAVLLLVALALLTRAGSGRQWGSPGGEPEDAHGLLDVPELAIAQVLQVEPPYDAAGRLRSDEGAVPRSQRGETRRHVGHGTGGGVRQPRRRAALDLGRAHCGQTRVDADVEPDRL